MKKLIAALSLLFVLSLTACGNSDAALRQENAALRQQILDLDCLLYTSDAADEL